MDAQKLLNNYLETNMNAVTQYQPQTQPENVMVGLTSSSGFELSQRIAKMFASSDLVPTAYKGNVANCLIALNLANRMGSDPLQTIQNLIIIQGRPTWSSQFLIATFNTCGRFTALRYEFFGEKGTDDWGCRAVATERETGEKLVGTDITIAIAKSEGWYNRNGSKWKTMPQQMLTYRAASWFVRAYAPELSMGLHTAEEAIDITDYRDVSKKPAGKSVDDLLNDPKVVDITTGEIYSAPNDEQPELPFTEPETMIKADRYALGKILVLIGEAKSQEKLEAIHVAIAELDNDAAKTAKTAWTKRAAALKKDNKPVERDIAFEIEACQDKASLLDLIDTLSDAEDKKYRALIDERLDFLRD
jgi:hypothetical protein